MTDKQYTELLQFQNMKGAAMIPSNANAIEFNEQLKPNELAHFRNVTERDLKLHRGYFLMLSDVYDYLPVNFKTRVPKDKFYKWLKMYQGGYEVIFKFQDGREFIEYESISFGRMDNHKFKAYVKTQIPIWYSLFQELLTDEFANNAIETIEENFDRLLSRL